MNSNDKLLELRANYIQLIDKQRGFKPLSDEWESIQSELKAMYSEIEKEYNKGKDDTEYWEAFADYLMNGNHKMNPENLKILTTKKAKIDLVYGGFIKEK